MRVYPEVLHRLLVRMNIDKNKENRMGKKRIHIKKKKDDNKNHVTLVVHNSSCGTTAKTI